MSGPLATWVSEHSKAGTVGRFVFVQLALAAYPDGTPAADVTRGDLERRTGLSLTSVRDGLAELRRSGEVEVLKRGGGRGRPTRYRIRVVFCEPGCWSCEVLATAQTGRHAPGLGETDKGGNRAPRATNRAPRATNRAPGARNRAPRAPTTDNGVTAPPLGGAVTSPESNDRDRAGLAADAAGASAPAEGEPAPLPEHIKAAWRAALAPPPPAEGDSIEERARKRAARERLGLQ